MSEARKMMQFEANKKSTGIAYLLWFFLGMLGVHRFYLGRSGSGAVILVLSIASFFLSFVGIGIFLFVIPAIWVLIDVFLIPGMAREYNNQLINNLGV